MRTNSNTTSQPEKLLYSYQKPLDEVILLGSTPRRLFRVFYPIRVIEVRGRQRLSNNMEEVQWFFEQGIHKTNISSAKELAFYFGLDSSFVERMLIFLREIGHIQGDDGSLTLTEIGVESIREKISYQILETKFMLYFDAIGNRPLSQEHFRVKTYDKALDNTSFFPLLFYFSPWRPEELERLLRRIDRHKYGLMHEVEIIVNSNEDKILYMPVYIVERYLDEGDMLNIPQYLVFDNIPGYRDQELEQPVNEKVQISNLLNNLEFTDFDKALDKRLNILGLKPENYEKVPNGKSGFEIVVDANSIIMTDDLEDIESNQSNQLTVNYVGRYLLVNDWCVWITCNNERVRMKAALQRSLQWLQKSYSNPLPEEIDRFIDLINRRLDLKNPITKIMLIDEANQRRLNKASERLDAKWWAMPSQVSS